MNLHGVKEPIMAQDVGLSGSAFFDADLSNARFMDADLSGARFVNVNMTGVAHAGKGFGARSTSTRHMRQFAATLRCL